MCDEYRKFGVVSFKLHSWVIKRMASFWRVGCIVFGLGVLSIFMGGGGARFSLSEPQSHFGFARA